MKKLILVSALAMSLPFMVGGSYAADQDRDQIQDRLHDQDQLKDQDRLRDQDRLHDGTPIYGSQLMTQQERNEYRAKMRSAKTAQERERLRYEHHEQMQERAKERGVTLPAQPPTPGGGGMRNNVAPNGGMGGGSGMGGAGGAGGGGGGGGGR